MKYVGFKDWIIKSDIISTINKETVADEFILTIVYTNGEYSVISYGEHEDYRDADFINVKRQLIELGD